MPERITHDHPTVETVDATVVRDGPTTRTVVETDADLETSGADLIRLVLDGTEYRARIEPVGSGRYRIRHAAKTPRMARNPSDGENKVLEWVSGQDLSVGRTIHLDIVEPGFRYGLRAPGEKAVYESGRPDDSLAAIARQVEEDDR